MTRVLFITLFIFTTLNVGATGRLGNRDELTVADGVSTSAYVPLYGLYMDAPQKSQTIYPADILTAISGDTIKGLIYYGEQSNFGWQSVVTISLGVTSLDSLSEGWSTDSLTDVYTGTLSLDASNQMEIVFTNPFPYAGGNLLIQFDSPESGNNYHRCIFEGMNYSAATRTSTGANYNSVAGTLRDFIPKTTFLYGMPPTCLKPRHLTVSSVTSSTAILSWEDQNGASMWNVEYGPEGFVQGTGTTIVSNTNPFVVEGLDANAAYDVMVQAICSDSDQSAWSNKASFHTLCSPLSIPYEQNFSDSIFPPACWERFEGLADEIFQGTAPSSITTGWELVSSDNGVVGQHMKLNVYGNARQHWIVTQSLSILPSTILSFDLALTKFNSPDAPTSVGDDDRFMVVILPNEGNTWSTSNATIWDNEGTDHVLYDVPTTAQRVFIDLSSYAGENVRIAFYGESTRYNKDVDIHIGNISLEIGEIPNCPNPSNLVATIVDTAVELSWEYVDGQENITYNVFRDTAMISTVDTTFYRDVHPMEGEHCYTVKAVCNGALSEPSNAACATILPSGCPSPTDLAAMVQGFDVILSWESLYATENTTYKVYRDSEEIATVSTTTYSDSIVSVGLHSYSVKMVCNDTLLSDPSNIVTVLLGAAPGGSELIVADGEEHSGYIPIYGSYMDKSQRSQTIYPADMLTAMVGDTIKSVLYDGTKSDLTWNSVVTVSMGITTLDSLSEGWATDPLTNVYTGTLSMNELKQMEIIFTTPFYYSGGNLLVQFNAPEEGNNYAGCFFTGMIAPSASRNIYGNDYETGAGNVRDFIPKTTFTYGAPPSCLKPLDLEIGEITPTSVTLSWSDMNGATSWNIEYGAPGFEQGTGTTVVASSNPFVLEGLENATPYSLRVQAVCSEEDQSAWTAPVSFQTLCGVASLPYVQNFESDTFPPVCWDRFRGLAGDIFQGTVTPTPVNYGWLRTLDGNGIENAHIKINIWGTSKNDWIVSQLIAIAPATVLSFDVALTAFSSDTTPTTTGADDKFMVVVLTDGGNTWSSDNATVWDQAGTDFVLYDIPPSAQRVSIDLSAYAGTDVRIAFYAESTEANADVDLHIGNISIEAGEVPSCSAPTNLVATAEGTNINLTWEYDDAADNTTYLIYRGTDLLDTVNTTSYGDMELPEGEHCYTVKAICGDLLSEPSNEACATIEAVVCDSPTNLSGIADGNTAKLTWEIPAKAIFRDTLLEEGFENGIPDGWLNVDADGDGRAWVTSTTELGGMPLVPHEGNGVVGSLSVYLTDDWIPLTPDNWLVTPDVSGAVKVSYWVRSQGNTSYDHETYCVYASSTNSELTSFISVFEEDLHDNVGQTWTKRVVDLPAGTKYIAFRHFNSTDNVLMVIDDIAIEGEAVPSNFTFKIFRDNVEVATTTTTNYDDPNLDPGVYNYIVKTVCENGLLSEPSNMAIITIDEPFDCPEPINLSATATPGNTINLTWELSSEGGEYSYKIYRDNVEIATVTETGYSDAQLANGTYTYVVKTVCDGGQLSEPSNEASATVSIDELEEQFLVYPNPANDKIFVAGENIENVSLFNIVGQQLNINTEGENGVMVLNVSHLERGIYMMRIVTRSGGVISKRIVVTR